MAATYAVTVGGTAAGQIINNHVGIRDTTTGTRDAQAVAGAVEEAWFDYILPYLSAFYTMTTTSCFDILDEEVGGASSSRAGSVGPNGGTALPTFVCVKVALRTGKRGRSFRGRTGLGPIPENYTDQTNTLSSAARQAAQTAFDAFAEGLADQDLNLCVISRYSGKDAQGKPLLRATPIWTPVTQYSVDQLVGSRVSRKA